MLLSVMVFLTATETKLMTITVGKISAPDRYIKMYTFTRLKDHLISVTIAIMKSILRV